MLDFGTFRVDLGESDKSRLGGVTAEGAMMDESQACMLDWKKWRLREDFWVDLVKWEWSVGEEVQGEMIYDFKEGGKGSRQLWTL